MENRTVYHTTPFYIGIDPSLRASGLAGLSSTDQALVSFTVKTPPSGPNVYARFTRIEEIVEALDVRITACGTPALIAIESYNTPALRLRRRAGASVHANNAGSCALIELGAVLRARCLANDWPMIEVPPANLKLFATGHGNADKAAVASSLTATFAQTFISADDADAYGLAQIARCCCQPDRYSAQQRAALRKIIVKKP